MKIFKVLCNILKKEQMKKCLTKQNKRVGIHAVGGPEPQTRNLYLLTISDLWSIGMAILR
jgi:hypothetical protein